MSQLEELKEHGDRDAVHVKGLWLIYKELLKIH